MNILKLFKTFVLTVTLAAATSLSLTSCNGVIYDEEGDCSVTYRLKFRYDMNLKWADAFANEVKSVHLYAFDQSGTLVWEGTESGSVLAADGYSMTLPLPAGNYKLVAWCGLDNEGSAEKSFTVPEATVGKTKLADITCKLNTRSNETYDAYSDKRLDFLFHGQLDVMLPENLDGGDYTYVMPLVKDTNHIRIILQQLSAEHLDVNQFNFRIEDANGFMGSDNLLIGEDPVNYLEWNKQSGTAGVGKPDILSASRGIIQVNGAIADFTVGRMMADHKKKMILTITNHRGELVAQVPVIQYALLAKDYYEEAYGHKMDDQEFLDREDEYVLTFFLDQNLQWISTSILIHSWRIVLHDYDLD